MTDAHMHDACLAAFSASPTRRMLLKSMIALGATGAVLGRFSEALAAASDEDVQITLMTQPGLVPEILSKIATPAFQAAHSKTKVMLEVSLNSVTYPKMLAQRSNPVITGGMFNDLYTQKGVNDNMWEKLDPTFVPNLAKVPKEMIHPSGYGAPLHLSPIGIMYNPSKVEKPKSWLDLFKPEYKGKVSMWDTWHDPYVMFAKASGMDPTVENGVKAWEPHKQNIGSFTNNTTTEEELVSRGEMWLAPHWGAWAEQARTTGKNVAFTVPEEGGIQWTAHIQSANGFSPIVTELTQRYLDIWLSDDVQTAWVERGFFSPSSSAVKLSPEAMKSEAIMTPDEAFKRLLRLDYNEMSTKTQQYISLIKRTLQV